MLLSHERSVKKEDMDRAELDAFLRQITPREQFYLDNPGAPSPRFKTMEHRTVRGRDVLYFHLQELPNDEIHLRKDSRFTDVPYYMHSNININYIYDGHCDYLIDDKPITLYKGDVCIFDLDVVRRKLTLGPSDIVINLNMTNEFFGDSFFHKAAVRTCSRISWSMCFPPEAPRPTTITSSSGQATILRLPGCSNNC